MKKQLFDSIEKQVRGEVPKAKNNIMLNIMKNQGYVPNECTLNGDLVFALINDGKNPCVGCNINCKEQHLICEVKK